MSLPFPLASAGSRLGGHHHHGRTSSGGGSTTTAAAAGEASKADSFSYVAEPTLRFVTDLPLRPENESEANLDRETSLVSASAAPVVVVDSPSPLLAASSSSNPASSEANHPADPNHAKRKRRVSLGALLHHHKKSGGSHGSASAPAGALPASSIDSARASPVPRPAPGAMPSSSSNGGPTMQPLASDAPMSMSSSEFLAQTEPEHISQGPHFFPARSRRSELGAVEAHPPPISHHPTASPPLSQSISAGRSSLDSSEEQRPTLTETEAFSGSSQGSLVGATSCPSVASTAPTSPGSHAQRHAREDSLDRNGTETFANAAKLASTPDPTRTNGAGAASTTAADAARSPPAYVSAASSTTTQSTEPARLSYSRSITRNIESLSLSNLRPRPSSSFASTVSSTTNDSTPSPQSNGTAAPARASLRGLPRLLSTSAIPTANGPADEEEQEQDPDESETDTEADDHSDEEGETYATSDEGPVTSPSGWVAFSGTTPTPGPMRSSRPMAAPGATTSYFDMPRPTNPSAAKTPMGSAIPTTPLVPMSMSDVARGKRPAMTQEEKPPTPPAPARTPGVPRTPAAASSAAAGPTASAEQSPKEASSEDAGVRVGLYRLRSQSVIALASPSMVDEDDQPVGTAALTGLDPVWQSGVPTKQRTPAPSFLSFTLNQPGPAASSPTNGFASTIKTPAALEMPSTSPVPASPATPDSPTRSRMQGVATAGGYRLHRTRSMYELRVPPPPYQNAYGRPGQPAQIVEAREEEGKEGLPGYTCAIHIEGYMPRKMEFTAPGVQARDRTWRRQYFVLHGTSIKIYKYNLRTHPIPGEDDWSVVPIDIAGTDGPPPLHFHEGEYGVAKESAHGGNAHHRFPLSIDEVKAKAKDRIVSSATSSAQNALVRHYSLQNAESGLAADYIKRKHVVRVRAEGEQFLLQAKDDRGVIDLIEALQAATNVALDLDARPLPKFITLPRRRRRRRRPVEGDAAAAAAAAAGGAASTDVAGAAANGAPSAAVTAGDRMGDMLAEEQTAYAQRASGTVM
ncbi:hypothetical protein JCM8115_002881 [Rhodotorula mucilaginosa]